MSNQVTTRAVWALLVLVLVFLLAFGVSGMYYAADYARTVKEQVALVDSIEVLNAKLADAEAQATERLKGWRSESRSTPMPDSSWTTTFTGARLSDLRRRSAESARRADSLLREPEGVR